MDSRPETNEVAAFVSTGRLPSTELVRGLVAEAHRRFTSITEGENSRVYPALARVPSELFGVCVVGTNGNVYAAGDAEVGFSIMSVAKPFVFALVCQALGPEGPVRRSGTSIRLELPRTPLLRGWASKALRLRRACPVAIMVAGERESVPRRLNAIRRRRKRPPCPSTWSWSAGPTKA